MTKIAVLVGSLRKESFTRKVTENLSTMFPSGYELDWINIGELPLYNQDFDDFNQVPDAYTEFRNEIKGVDAVLFATPEYNRSVPAVLKNALDVGSRPYGESVWDGKPALIISVAPGNISGFGANHHLRQSLVFLNMPVVQQPEAYIGNVTDLMDESGTLTNDETKAFLHSVVEAFVHLIETHKTKG